MQNTFFVLFFICHILGNFYVKKSTYYGLPFAILYLFFHAELPAYGVLFIFILLISHQIYHHYRVNYTYTVQETYIFLIYHTVSLISIFLISNIFFLEFEFPYVNTTILQWFAYILFIGRPSNSIFKLFFRKYQVETNEDSNGAGSIIGIMERILMIMFLSVQQYTAIGFVLTAKSITRFDRITKDSKFAEYYLIGTLYSVMIAIAPYLLLFELH